MTQPPHTTEQPKREVWHSQSAEEVQAQLGSATTGLSAQEAAQQRLAMVAVLVRLIVIMLLPRRARVAKEPNSQPNDRLERLNPKDATA